MNTYLPYYEEDERNYNQLKEEGIDLEAVCREMTKEDEKIERLIHRRRDPEFQQAIDEQAEDSMKHSETGMVRRCILESGHTVKHTHTINYAKPQNVSKEWAKLFLRKWNDAVAVWNDGELFGGKIWPSKPDSQRYYASICCSWLIPNGFEEPHQVAQGK